MTELLPEDAPVVLLPVRLETRFVTDAAGPALLVRIYPDEIHVDSHRAQLSDAEVAAGTVYAQQISAAGGDVEAQRVAFEDLAGRVGRTRALYVARLSEGTLPAPDNTIDPVGASCLPERWSVHGFRGNDEVASVIGAAVPADLRLGPAADDDIDESGPPVDAGSAWLVDFKLAVNAGMAVRLPMPDDGGLDRLVVVGVRADEPLTGADRLAALLDGHRFGAGLDLLGPGTPTNNTDGQRSAWTRRPDARELYDATLAADPAAPDVTATGGALGIVPDTLAGAPHQGASLDPAEARAMNRALWAATLGYVLETLAGTAVDDDTIEAARRLFVEAVRGLGPLPTLRVGAQPYGLLPATSVRRWQPADEDDATTSVVELLRRLAPEWLAASDDVPHVTGNLSSGTDPDQELLDILGREGVSGSYRLRPVRGGTLTTAVAPLVPDLDPAGRDLANAARHLVGMQAAPPLAGMAFDPRTVRIRREPVLAGPLSETDPLPAPEGGVNYLQYLAERSERDAAYDGPGATSLLRALAQHSAALADLDAAVRFTSPASVAGARSSLEPEVVDAAPGRAATTAPRFMARPVRELVPGSAVDVSAAEFIATATAAEATALGPHVRDALRRTTDVRRALGELAPVPSARLDRLTRAALDTCSHRLDAWLTAVATQRLSEVRATRPVGCYVGGYGWVDNLTPKPAPLPATTVPTDELGELVVDPTNAGFVVAPSLAQAGTAALLLSGHLSHRLTGTQAADAFAVDLSSDRARAALWLLDGVRQGQPLGSLLGYQFERGLHDRSRVGLELDRFVRPLRALAPLVADAQPSQEAVESIAASGVVDGLELLRRASRQPADVDAVLASATPAEAGAVRDELVRLTDTADAVADLVLAETVHQVASGNFARAAAMSDAVGSGLGPPSEPEVLATPRPAHDYQHRLVVLAPPASESAPGWAAERPRRRAEPRLDHWVADLLPAPADIRYAVRVVDGSGGTHVLSRRLSQDDVCALDLLHTAELELLLTEAVAAAEVGVSVELLSPTDADWPGGTWPPQTLPLEDAVQHGRWILDTVGASRPLKPADLVPAGAASGTVDEQELTMRADTATAEFRALVAQLGDGTGDPAQLRAALTGLGGYGVAGAGHAVRELRERGAEQGVGPHVTSVIAEAARISTQLDTTPPPTAHEALHTLFGEEFSVLPVFAAAPEFTQAATVGSTAAFLDGDPSAPMAWVQRMALVRAPLERYLLAAAGAPAGVLPVQLPQADTWVGLPFADDDPRPDHALSVLVHAPVPRARAGTLAGFVVDEWTDRIPAAGGTAGVAFNFDEPGARAPQSVLIAVPPQLGEPWSDSALLDVVRETADLARIRMVGPEEVPWLGRYLPALLVADNALGDTLGIDLRAWVSTETS
jgi:hypothetical protein